MQTTRMRIWTRLLISMPSVMLRMGLTGSMAEEVIQVLAGKYTNILASVGGGGASRQILLAKNEAEANKWSWIGLGDPNFISLHV